MKEQGENRIPSEETKRKEQENPEKLLKVTLDREHTRNGITQVIMGTRRYFTEYYLFDKSIEDFRRYHEYPNSLGGTYYSNIEDYEKAKKIYRVLRERYEQEAGLQLITKITPGQKEFPAGYQLVFSMREDTPHDLEERVKEALGKFGGEHGFKVE